MKKGIIGRKLGMTQIFADNGAAIPVTVIEAGPCPVVQKKTAENDGYDSVQLGFDDIREKLVTKDAVLDEVLPPTADSRKSVAKHPNREKYLAGLKRGEGFDVLYG